MLNYHRLTVFYQAMPISIINRGVAVGLYQNISIIYFTQRSVPYLYRRIVSFYYRISLYDAPVSIHILNHLRIGLDIVKSDWFLCNRDRFRAILEGTWFLSFAGGKAAGKQHGKQEN